MINRGSGKGEPHRECGPAPEFSSRETRDHLPSTVTASGTDSRSQMTVLQGGSKLAHSRRSVDISDSTHPPAGQQRRGISCRSIRPHAVRR